MVLFGGSVVFVSWRAHCREESLYVMTAWW